MSKRWKFKGQKSLLTEKAKSKSQQRLFGLALSVKKGDKKISDVDDSVKDDIKRIVDNMSEKEIRDFAETDTKGLPDKVESKLREYVRDRIRELMVD